MNGGPWVYHCVSLVDVSPVMTNMLVVTAMFGIYTGWVDGVGLSSNCGAAIKLHGCIFP